MLFAGRVREAVRAAAELGFDGIEISAKSPAELADVDLGALLAGHGLQLAAIASGRIFADDGLSLSLPEAARRDEAARRLNELIDVAGEHGAQLIVGLLRGPRPADGDVPAANARLVDTLGGCADHASAAAARHRPRGHQPLRDHAAVHGGRDARPRRAGRPPQRQRAARHLPHEHRGGVASADAIRRDGQAPRATSTSPTATGARRASGHVDFDAVLAALDDIDYDGWISAEILPLPDDRAAAEQAARPHAHGPRHRHIQRSTNEGDNDHGRHPEAP